MTDAAHISNTGWSALLDRVHENIPRLLDEFLAELREYEGYSSNRIPATDLEGTARRVFELFLDRLNTTGAEVDSEFTSALGRRRARQGMRVDQFTEAVRINFRLLWRALHQAAHPDLVDVLMDNTERVLDVVERYATEVQRSFLDETENMVRSRRSARERALTRVFSGASDADELTDAASALGMQRDDAFEIIAMSSAAVPAALSDELSRDGAYAYEDEKMTYLFRHVADSATGSTPAPTSAVPISGILPAWVG